MAEGKLQHMAALRGRAKQGLIAASLDGRLLRVARSAAAIATNVSPERSAAGASTLSSDAVGRGEATSSWCTPPWLTEALASHRQREDGLSSEIFAVREAAAAGASALIDLRQAVQAQIEAVIRQVARLEQDLSFTKLELAEVVIEKETSEGNLRFEVEGVRADIEQELLRTRGHFNEMNVTVREALESQVAETLQATDRETRSLRHLVESLSSRVEASKEEDQLARDVVARRLEERLQATDRDIQASKEETMSYFHKIDKVMHHETSGVMQKLDNLSRAQSALEESSRRASDEAKRLAEEGSGHARKFQEVHEKLEPRVFHLEEAQRHAEARAERMQEQVRNLLASRYSSPADEGRPSAEESTHQKDRKERKESNVQSAAALTSSPTTTSDDDAWRFSHSAGEPATRSSPLPASVGNISSMDRNTSSGHVRDGPSRDTPIRDGPSRAAAPHVSSQPQQPKARQKTESPAETRQQPPQARQKTESPAETRQQPSQAFRTPAAPSLQSTRSPPRAAAPNPRAPPAMRQ